MMCLNSGHILADNTRDTIISQVENSGIVPCISRRLNVGSDISVQIQSLTLPFDFRPEETIGKTS